ncbi:ABC transporter permease [Aquipuribacter hungaricus]|uniref:Transport permease protein n=1 Tax=Aquipuribacter hungaricus TaxID=545624 RepID=A0ABV7WJR3_9MICO
MSGLVRPALAAATAGRVLHQVRGDRRSLAMVLVLPAALLSVMAWLYEGGPAFDRVGPAMLALFPFVVMFLLTSVTTLRERQTGTLERLLTTPLGKADLVLGYGLAFGLLATAQAVLAVGVAVGLLGLDVRGPVAALLLVAVVDAVLGTALGLLASAFAATELQAVQMMPAVVLPQVLLCGLLVPRASLPDGLRELSSLLPLSHAVDAMTVVARWEGGVAGGAGGDLAGPLLVVVAFAAAALAGGAATLRRRTA